MCIYVYVYPTESTFPYISFRPCREAIAIQHHHLSVMFEDIRSVGIGNRTNNNKKNPLISYKLFMP